MSALHTIATQQRNAATLRSVAVRVEGIGMTFDLPRGS